jgi:hypothetical protein
MIGPDDLKFRSCLTLFGKVASDNSDRMLFIEALDQFYGGEPDSRTLEPLSMLRSQKYSPKEWMRTRQPGKTELTAAQLKPGIGQTAAALYRVTCARSSAPMSTRDIADAFARHPPRATPGLGNLASPQTRFLMGDERVPRSSRRVKQSKRSLFDSHYCGLAPRSLSKTASIGPSDKMLPWLAREGA